MDDSTMDDLTQIPDDELVDVGMGGADLGTVGLSDAGMGGAGLMDPSMDDLFGEAADGLGVPVTLPSVPLPASVIFRVDDMQRIGCCSKLAWSNTGYVAQILEHGKMIGFRTTLRDQKTRDWTLSEQSKHTIQGPESREFVHIQFNGFGTDLAACDSHGFVRLYTMTGVLGRLAPANVDGSVSEGARSELDVVVGMHWLPMWPNEYRAPYITPANKVGDTWTTQTQNPDPNTQRPHHPIEGKNALLYVSQTCCLHLLYQNESMVWHSTAIELETWNTSNDLLTHAAISEDGDHIVLVTHDHARRIRVYKISIHWNAAQQTRNNINFVTVAPTLEVGHLTILDKVSPQHSDLAKLSLLRVVPRTPQFVAPGQSTGTYVLAVFTHVSVPLGMNLHQQQPDAFSVIARWTIDTASSPLHASFTKLKPTGPTPVLRPVTRLRRLEDLSTENIVLAADPYYHNTAVMFAYSDGTTELRERETWAVIQAFGDTTVASSLPQSGFELVAGDQTADVVLNADGSLMASTKPDSTLIIKHMNSRYGFQPLDDGISDTKGLIESSVVCLARQYAILCSSNYSTDEILAVLPNDLANDMRALFVKQVLRILCRYIDVSMYDQPRQQQLVVREPYHVRAVSAQLVLGTRPGGNGERDFAGQFAYAYLNVRYIGIALAQTFTSRDNNALGRNADLVPSLVGLARWSMDLMVFIIDSLTQVKRGMQTGESVKKAFERFAKDTGNPALHLLLCSYPRVLLRMQTSIIPTYIKWARASLQQRSGGRSLEQRQQMEDVVNMAKGMPLNYGLLAEFNAEVDNAVRNAWTESGVSAEQRVELELGMLAEGSVPDELAPVLQALVDNMLPKLCEGADMGKLYFQDTAWLGVTGVRPAKGRIMRYDAIRKVPLPLGTKVRLCRRCGAEMEDLPQEQLRQAPDWLRHASRHCFCQDYWWPL